jgi:DNA-directed RNA polymerase specialized sigma24 family protein
MGGTGMASGSPEASGCSALTAGSSVGEGRSRARSSADAAARQALAKLYEAHYRSLLRLAALLTGDPLLAEDVAAAALVSLASGPPATRVPERALFHLRQQVVARSRRAARPRSAARRGESRLPVPGWQNAPVISVLRSLPAHQREAIVLSHYLDLGEQETAALMGASRRAVRSCLATALGAFQAIAAEEPERAVPDGG